MFPKLRFFGINVFYWGHILDSIIVVMFFIWYSRKCRINAEKAFLLAILITPFTVSAMYIVANLDSIGGFNWVRAVIFMPVVIYLISLTIDLPFIKTMDFIAPAAALHHGISHIFCIFIGCCYGYPSSFGIWNEEQQDYLFPVQLFESATSLLIFCYLLWYAKRKKYDVHGISYGQFLFLFGLTRTFWEFFRDNTKIFWKISLFQYYSFAAFVLGLIWLGVAFYLQKHPRFVEKHGLLSREDAGELTKIRMFLRKIIPSRNS
ncbi:prolipoprotein diacylglyceryl transferase [bacterium]|nr:prolipoprotein diacylglyceryl transferase [bacterium]